MAKVLAIISGKGGVGKTIIAINLALALNNYGRRVILVDGDVKKPDVSIYIGHDNNKPSLHDVLEGKIKIKDAAIVHSSGLKYIAGDKSYERLSKNLLKNFKRAMLDEIKSEELIILDTPPGLSSDFKKVISLADYAIIVTTPELAAVADAAKAIRICAEHKLKIYGAIINMKKGIEGELGQKEIESVLGVKVLGLIPEDRDITHSGRMELPLMYSHPDSKSADKFKEAAARFLGKAYEEKQIRSDKLFDYMMKKLGLR